MALDLQSADERFESSSGTLKDLCSAVPSSDP